MGYAAPNRDSVPWDSVVLRGANKAEVRLPPRPGIGVAVVSVPDAQKLDKKGKAGKKGATVTKQGAESADVTIKFTFRGDAWAEVEPVLAAISPRGAARGGPFSIECPGLPDGIEAITIESISPRGTACIQRGKGEVTIKAKETSFDRNAGPGSGTGAKPRGLTAAERAALAFEIETLKQMAIVDATVGPTQEGSSAGYKKINKALGSTQERIAELQRRLDEADSVPPNPTETTTPGKPGDAVPGQGVKSGKLSGLQPASYSPAKNPDAPKGGP